MRFMGVWPSLSLGSAARAAAADFSSSCEAAAKAEAAAAAAEKAAAERAAAAAKAAALDAEKVEEAKAAVAREVSARASAPAKIILCYAELGDIDEVMHLHGEQTPPSLPDWAEIVGGIGAAPRSNIPPHISPYLPISPHISKEIVGGNGAALRSQP